MQVMRPWKAWGASGRHPLPPGRSAAYGGISLCLAFIMTGCSSSISTPLPDLKPSTSTAMSQQDRQKAMEELNRKRDTHEEEAERQIEAAQ